MTQEVDTTNSPEDQPLAEKPRLAVVKVGAAPTESEWHRVPRFIRSGKGGPAQKVLANALEALDAHRHWQGVLRYDAMSLHAEATKAPPWLCGERKWTPRPWEDQDDNLFTEWLQRKGVLVGVQIASTAVQTYAKKHAFHPVQEYLNRLCWDGTQRLGTWLVDYMGAESGDYPAAVGTRWMIAAVARILQPGCKVDSMLVFEGVQDQGKSTVLRRLSEPWFSDTIKDLGHKDTAMSIAGRWIVEFQELEAFKGASIEQLKAFLSRNEDRFRPPYGRAVIDSPRQCVFAGTTNLERYLIDETGNRRFWPVACLGSVRPEAMVLARDQLWAEAVHLYSQENRWWLDTPELKAMAHREQEARYDADPWEEGVSVYLAKCAEVTTTELLETLEEIDRTKIKRSDQMRMAKILHHLGWHREQKTLADGRRIYVFRCSKPK